MLARVMVGVALSRPPKLDDSIMVLVEADTENEAQLIAAQIASANPLVVMPVSTEIIDLLEI